MPALLRPLFRPLLRRGLRPSLAVVAVGAALGGWACALTFPCSSDEQCTRDGTAGVCQASGYCSFPDASCESDQRYGDLAPGELAGTCVPVDDAAGSGTGPTEPTEPTGDDAGTSATSTSGMGSAGSGSLDASTTEGGLDESSDSGDPGCCYAGCEGTCEGSCEPAQIGGPARGAEAIGVAVVGDWVVWSTGYGRTLEISNVVEGTDEQLASVSGNSFVTKIAADDTHVYFVDYGGPTVKRASVPGGAVDLVTQVDQGMAAFGGIAVNSEHVYFAMRDTGGIWRAAKDLSDQMEAEPVADAMSPFDVVLDETTVYWIDNGTEQIARLALEEIGMETTGTPVYSGPGLTTLAVDETHVYYGDGSNVGRAVKDGLNEGIQTLVTGQGMIWDIAVDQTHVYWTSASNHQVARLSLASGEVELLADSSTPWGLDLSCQAVFWAENGTQTLQTVPK